MNKNVFKALPKDNNFVRKILPDISVINFTEEEANKLKVFLSYETDTSSLFLQIEEIYRIIGANFSNPSKFLIIPFVVKGQEFINIQKID